MPDIGSASFSGGFSPPCRGEYGFVGRPSSFQAVADGCRRQANNAPPFGQAAGFSPRGDVNIIPPIAVLGCAGGPTAVVGGIAAVRVDPINGHPRIGLAHVGKKVGEVVPSCANGDPSTAVAVELRHIRIIAPAPHFHPAPVRRRANSGAPVGRKSPYGGFVSKAAAGSRVSLAEVRPEHLSRGATVTQTSPFAAIAYRGKDDKTAESAAQHFRFAHEPAVAFFVRGGIN